MRFRLWPMYHLKVCCLVYMYQGFFRHLLLTSSLILLLNNSRSCIKFILLNLVFYSLEYGLPWSMYNNIYSGVSWWPICQRIWCWPWYGLNSILGNFCMPQVLQKKKKRKRKITCILLLGEVIYKSADIHDILLVDGTVEFKTMELQKVFINFGD